MMPETMTFPTSHMIDNIAVASQRSEIIDDPVVRGAILRSVHQFIRLNWACTGHDLCEALEADEHFNE